MSWLVITLVSIAALVFMLAGVQKVLLLDAMTEPMRRLGTADGLTRFIGLLELSGATGLIIGIWYRPLGVAAGIGLVALLLGAIVFHARAGDYRGGRNRGSAMAPIGVLIVLGVAGTLLAI